MTWQFQTRGWRLIAMAAALLCLVVQPAQAERRVALVIGNNAYSALTPDSQLKKAANDARTIGAALRDMGFEVILKTDASRRETLAALRDFSDRVGSGDTAVFFFAGHGVQIGGNNYLLPSDVEMPKDEQQVADQALELHDVMNRVQVKNAKFTMAVIDACRNNPFRKGGTRAIGSTRGLTTPVTPDGIYVVYSAGANEQALDDLGNGDRNPNSVFTREFVQALKTPGLSADQAVKKAREQVRTAAGSVGHKQNPAIYDQTHGEFFFLSDGGGAAATAVAPPPAPSSAPAAAATAPADSSRQAVELAFWQAIQDSTDPAEFEEYLRKYPKGEFAIIARRKLKALKPQTAAASPPPPPPPATAEVRKGSAPKAVALQPVGDPVLEALARNMVRINPGRFVMGSSQ
jgi:uncharacterized caspase-like protein